MIDRDEYTVRVLDMPESVGGFITESPDGFLNIYINARYGWRGQRKSMSHELHHAEHDDLHSTESVATIEARADSIDPRLRTIPQLMCARDLLHKTSQEETKPKTVRLTPRQLRTLFRCLAELDSFC